MIIGTLIIELQLPQSHSLKEKRHILVPLLNKLRHTFSVSAAEVASQDKWQAATIGLACVSNSSHHADEMSQKMLNYIEGNGEVIVLKKRFELIHL